MKPVTFLFIIIILIAGCNTEETIEKEPWIEKPVSEWPTFALTNDISFSDTTFVGIANSFLVNTGKDTLAVSCKHIFIVFQTPELTTIDLGEEFNYWNFYPKNDPSKKARSSQLINTNKQEPIGEFRTLKDRDWIILELDIKNKEIYPLKIRFQPLEKNEVIYAVGWGMNQKDNSFPAVTKLQCYRNEGNYYYVKTISTNTKPHGKSGSPVIDKNGYLVGIVSGAEGNLGVIGSIKYLQKLLDKYGIDYIYEN